MKTRNRKEIQRAVALAYDPDGDGAPKMAAKGSGSIAEKIILIAREKGIPIHEDPELVNILSQLHLEDEIPPQLYEIVAEILAFIYKLNERRMRKISQTINEGEKGDI
jgi:flagellar biosynthesis protein